MVGRILAHYEIVAKLGEGGMGVVYKARDQRLRRFVALKTLPADKLTDPVRKQRFIQEAQTASALNHPSIITIHDISSAEGVDFLVMELVSGQALKEKIGELSLEEALDLALQMGDALAVAHKAGIIHRDLKPGNVMITDSGLAKILDFGLAKLALPEKTLDTMVTTMASPLTQVGAVLGTPAYMSPEQALGDAVDCRSDIFSFGLLLYEMLTGRRPFEAANNTALLHNLIYEEPPLPSSLKPSLPYDLDGILKKALAKKPDDRHQTMRELCEDLEEIRNASSGASLSTVVGTVWKSSGRAARTLAAGVRRWRAVSTAAAMILLIASALLVPSVRDLIAPWLPVSVQQMVQASPLQLYQEGQQRLRDNHLRGGLDRAIEAFEKALARDPNHAPASAGLALAYHYKYAQNQDAAVLNRAWQAASRAVQLNEHLALARVALGAAHADAGRAEEAHAELKRALAIDPLNAAAYRELALLQAQQGDIETAVKTFRKAIELEPDWWANYIDLGKLHYDAGNYREARDVFKTAAELSPDNQRAYRNLAAAYHMLGEYPEAASNLQKSLEIEPEATGFSNLGNLYYFQGLYREAASAMEKAVQLGPNFYLRWGNLGDVYRLMPESRQKAADAYRRAIQLIEQQLKLKPEDLTLRSRLALYLAKSGQAERSWKELIWVEEEAGDQPAAWFRTALAYEITGRRDKALEALEKALAAGYSLEEVRQEPELAALREDVRYHQMMVRLDRG